MQEGDKQEKHEKHVLDQFVSDEEISAEAVEEISHRNITEDTDIEEADKILAMRDRAASKSSWRHFKYLLRKTFSIRDDALAHEEIGERLLSNGRITGINTTILLCAILIACVGLITDSIAVIIGAMLISPLMGTLLALAYDICTGKRHLFFRHLAGFAIQVASSLAIATIFFLICRACGVTQFTAQLKARTSPTVFDVIIAAAGGIAGILASTRQSQYSNVIPGVAIATALMPPLCTVGYALANGQWIAMAAAGYLFAINAYFILMTSVVVLALLQVPKSAGLTVKQWRKTRIRMTINAIVVAIPVVALLVLRLTNHQPEFDVDRAKDAAMSIYQAVDRLL